jgi:hypothetical protein
VIHSVILLNNQSFDVNNKPFYAKSQSFNVKTQPFYLNTQLFKGTFSGVVPHLVDDGLSIL